MRLALALPRPPAGPLLAGSAEAACDVKGAKLEEAIAQKSELRETANKQTVRDLRTLRDAAIVLDTYKYGPNASA